MSDQLKEGTVKFFNATKGFGFIVDDHSQTEIFVHATGLIDDIYTDARVVYNTKDGKKGLNAVDVRIKQ